MPVPPPLPPAIVHPSFYPAYGNMTLSDCTIAAAADWYDYTYDKVLPSPAVVAAYSNNTSSPTTGVTLTQLNTIWSTQGIAGTYATVSQATLNPAGQPQLAVLALPAGFSVVIHQTIRSKVSAVSLSFRLSLPQPAVHAVLVIGYATTGVRIVTWGGYAVIPYDQWHADFVAAYDVEER